MNCFHCNKRIRAKVYATMFLNGANKLNFHTKCFETVAGKEYLRAMEKDFVECIVDGNGNKHWYQNGKCHRKDGPAVEYVDGSKEWYQNGRWHREDGPAVENADGSKEWRINDILHRENGPTVEYANGHKEWYLNGKKLTEKEFQKRTKKETNNENNSS